MAGMESTSGSPEDRIREAVERGDYASVEEAVLAEYPAGTLGALRAEYNRERAEWIAREGRPVGTQGHLLPGIVPPELPPLVTDEDVHGLMRYWRLR